MASNPPQKCCTEGFKLEGTPQGKLIDIGKISTYVSGDRSSTKVLLILTDILGHKFPNSQLVADAYAKQGFYVVVPDIFNGDPTKPGEGIPDGWLDKHGVSDTEPVVQAVVQHIRSELATKFFASIGYCFGAKYTVRLLAEDAIDAGAAAHPSFVQIDEVAQIKKPLIILAAETDQIYTPELRAKTEAKLQEIKATYYTTLSSGVTHGFAVRSDPKDKWATAMAGKAFSDSVWWFEQFSN